MASASADIKKEPGDLPAPSIHQETHHVKEEQAPPPTLAAMISYEKARERLGSRLQSLSETKAFICTECGRTYGKHSSLKSHQKVHTGVRPHACHLCHKTFYYKSNLNSHLKIHQEEKALSCAECGDTFQNSSNLITHRKVHARENAHSIKLRQMLRQ